MKKNIIFIIKIPQQILVDVVVEHLVGDVNGKDKSFC